MSRVVQCDRAIKVGRESKLPKQYVRPCAVERPAVSSSKSTYLKGLAPSRRMKKGGRAAVSPLGQVNPPPAAKWRENGVLDCKVLRLEAIIAEDFGLIFVVLS